MPAARDGQELSYEAGKELCTHFDVRVYLEDPKTYEPCVDEGLPLPYAMAPPPAPKPGPPPTEPPRLGAVSSGNSSMKGHGCLVAVASAVKRLHLVALRLALRPSGLSRPSFRASGLSWTSRCLVGIGAEAERPQLGPR